MMQNSLNAISTERASRRFWVTLILAFFALDITIAIVAIVMAAGDPSFRSIPGFGERAVAWDERRMLAEAWQNQNWDVSIRRIGPEHREVEIQITRHGEPVVHCTGNVKLFHFTRVAEQRTSTIQEVDPGIYRAQCDVSKPGYWNVEVELLTPDQTRCWQSFTLEWIASADPRETSQ